MRPVHRLTSIALLAAALAPTQLHAQEVAYFDFDSRDLTSPQPGYAQVTDLNASNHTAYGGSRSDRWLCLTTAWNLKGGTLSFMVTPQPGVNINFSQLYWSAVTNNASLSDSVRTATIKANGETISTIDPLTHNTTHRIALTDSLSLQNVSGPVLFEIDFAGNPTGQSSYEIGDLGLIATPCFAKINKPTPESLPTLTRGCFLVPGDCLDQVSAVTFGGQALAQAPAPFGDGSYRIVSRNQLEVCPPQCLPAGEYTITAHVPGDDLTTTIDLTTPTAPTLVCAVEHPVTTMQCLYLHSGGGQKLAVLGVSMSNLPSSMPGVLDLDIGDDFSSIMFAAVGYGECVEACIGVIRTKWIGLDLNYQAAFIDLNSPVVPIPVTNACTTHYIQ